MAKIICQIRYTKNNRSKQNGNKDEKALYELKNDAVYSKTMKTLTNMIDVRLINNENMSQKLFDKDLVVIRKNKFILTLNKQAYVGMCILDTSKTLM